MRRGVGFVPQNNNVFPSLTIEENLRMGMFQNPKRFAERFAFIADLFPTLGGPPAAARRVAVRWRAADGRDGPGAHDGAVRAAARRAVGRPVAGPAGRDVHPDPQDQQGRRLRSSSSSRTRAAPCRSATAATSSTRAATPTPGPGRELMNDPKVIELYLGTLATDVEAATRPAAPAHREA